MTAPPRPRRRTRALLTLYAHPFEVATLVGILGASALNSGLDPTILATVLSPRLVVVWVIANALGIIAATVGLFGSSDISGATPRRTATMRATEKAGLWVVAATTAGLMVAVTVRLRPWSEAWQPLVQLGAIVAACALRAIAIRKAERIQLCAVRELSRQVTEDGRP